MGEARTKPIQTTSQKEEPSLHAQSRTMQRCVRVCGVGGQLSTLHKKAVCSENGGYCNRATNSGREIDDQSTTETEAKTAQPRAMEHTHPN